MPMNEDMREMINEFIVESDEGLDRLDSDLVELETNSTAGGVRRTKGPPPRSSAASTG